MKSDLLPVQKQQAEQETITVQYAVPKHFPSAFILLERQGSVVS